MTRAATLNEEAITEGYASGKSLRELAAEHGVSTGPIQRILARRSVERRRGRGPDRRPRLARARARAPSRFSPRERAQIASRFLAGETQLALAAAFNCGATTIGRILRAENIPAGAHGQLRAHHHNWKGGRIEHVDGYVMVRVSPDDALAQAMRPRNSYLLEHRLVMARALGRPLERHEQVHHINGDKADNRPENLQLRAGPHGVGSVLRCRKCGSHDVEAVELGGVAPGG